MIATRATGLWPGLFAIIWLTGLDSSAAGSMEEGASRTPPLSLGAPELLVEADRGVDVAGQILWSDPLRIHVFGLVPEVLLAVDPVTGIVDQLAGHGPGPFELDGPVASMSAGARPQEILVHLPGHSRSILFSRDASPVQVRHQVAVTGCVVDAQGAWWLGPRLWDPHGGKPAQIDLWRGPVPDSALLERPVVTAWSAFHAGEAEEVLLAQYYTRLLQAPGGRLWRVVLGPHPQVDLIDPGKGAAQICEIDPAEGFVIEASADQSGRLYLLTAGGSGSFGRRILRIEGPGIAPVVFEGDRLWNTGAINPDGSRWAAAEADAGDLLVYAVP